MKRLIFSILPIFLISCTSIITASKSGEGIPYYLPKPYILVTKNIPLINEHSKSGTVEINEGQDVISFKIIYLPDLREKHNLQIKSGTGNLETEINFVDGWKLTGINLKAEAKTSEIIEAIGTIIEKIPLKTTEEKRAEIWLYEMVVEDGKIKFLPVFHKSF